MVKYLTDHLSRRLLRALGGCLSVLFLLSVLSWSGCAGGSSTDESAGTEEAEESASEDGDDDMETAEADTAEAEPEAAEPPGEAPFETTFLDAQTELFIFARLGEILDSSLVQTFTGGDLGPLNDLEGEWGVSPRDIDTITVGVSNLAQLAKESAAAMPMLGPGTGPRSFDEDLSYEEEMALLEEEMQDEDDVEDYDLLMRGDQSPSAAGTTSKSGKGVVAVVRTKSPIDLERFEGKADVERIAHGQKAYYRAQAGPQEVSPCLYLHDAKTLIVADEVTIQNVIDQGEKRARPTADLGFVESAPHFLLAIAPKDKAEFFKAGQTFDIGAAGLMPPGGFPGGLPDVAPEAEQSSGRDADAAETAGLEEHLEALAVLIDFSAGIDLSVAVKCDTADAAQQMLAEADRGLNEAKTQFEAAQAELPGVIRQIAQPMIDSLEVAAAESVVTVSLALPEDSQSLLPMLPMAVMGMMMSSAMEAGPGGEFAMTPSLGEFAQEILFDGHLAANADELPEGMELKALARWGESLYGDQAPAPLEIGIVASGGPAATAVAFGQLKLAAANVDETTSLKWTGTMTESFDQNPVTDLIAIERDSMFSEHPPEAVVTGFVTSAPVDPVEALGEVVGEFSLQIAGSVLDATVADVRNARITGSGAEQLSTIGFIVSVANEGGEEQLEVAYDESPLVGPIELVGPDGRPLETVGTGWSSSGGRKTLTFGFAGGLPPGTGVRATLYDDLQTVVVPFRLENLPLPEPQELTDEQKALLVWTPVEAPAGIDGLTIEAQGRWRTLEPVGPGAGEFDQGFPRGAGQFGELGELSFEEQMERELAELDDPDDSPAGYQQQSEEGGLGRFGLPRGQHSENPLQIVIDLMGPLAETAEGLGFVEVSLAKSDIDTDLAFEGAEFGSGFGDPTAEFVDIDRDMMFGADHPPEGLRVVLKLTPPNQPIQSVTRLNGSLKFKTVRERTDAIVKNLQSRVGKPISNPDLAKFRIKPVVGIEGNRLMMRLVEGKDDRISEVIPVDLNDRPITDVIASQQTGGAAAEGRTIYMFDFPGGIPEKVGLQFYLNMGVEEISVPIRIRDLPLPPKPAEEQ